VIFRPELAAKVMAGEKTVTRRLCSENPRSPWWRERCIYVEGKVFAVQPGRGKPSIGRARVVNCSREPLGVLTNTAARREGFASMDEFREAWKEINGRYDIWAEVWRIEFEVIR
jgi:hypothetical protein